MRTGLRAIAALLALTSIASAQTYTPLNFGIKRGGAGSDIGFNNSGTFQNVFKGDAAGHITGLSTELMSSFGAFAYGTNAAFLTGVAPSSVLPPASAALGGAKTGTYLDFSAGDGTGAPTQAGVDYALGYKAATHIANNAALLTFDPTKATTVRVGGRIVPGDGGAATYNYVASTCAAADGVTQITASDGKCFYIDPKERLTPEVFAGAIGTATDANVPTYPTIDAASILQKMADTGRTIELSDRMYRVKSCITLKTPGQRVIGVDRWRSRIIVADDFVLGSCPAIFKVDSTAIQAGSHGPQFENFAIMGLFHDVVSTDPIATQLASLPDITCIDSRNVVSTSFRHMLITGCMNGIDLRGQTGPFEIDDVEGLAYNIYINIDGAKDTQRISRVHAFPLYMTANQKLLTTANAVGFSLGRSDDFKISNSLVINAKSGIKLYTGVARTLVADGYISDGGNPSGAIVTFDCDAGLSPCLNVSGGNTTASGLITSSDTFLAQTGGQLSVGGLWGTAKPGFITVGGGGNPTFNLNSSGNIAVPALDGEIITQTSGYVSLIGNNFSWDPGAGGINLTTAKIHVSGGKMTSRGNRIWARGVGTGTTLYQIDNDDAHDIDVGAAPGWTNTFPTNPLNGAYVENSFGKRSSKGGFNVSGGGANYQGGGSEGCHFTFNASTFAGFLACVKQAVGWRSLFIDALQIQMMFNNPGGTVNIGTSGAVSKFTLTNTTFRRAAYTYATRPASPATGDSIAITDATSCTFGANITAGGGSTYCPATYTGANWQAY